MARPSRKRVRLGLPISLNVVLITLNVTLMVAWIVSFASIRVWSALTIGTIVFALMLVGLALYLVVTIQTVRLTERQVNFVDSVTHELKTPIAAMRLYLETLQLRELDADRRREFYDEMNTELQRLDLLISQLLEVARLDAIGQETEPEDVALEPLLRQAVERTAIRHRLDLERVFQFDIEDVSVFGRRIALELLFGNLLDNAVKYGGEPPEVTVRVRADGKDRRVVVEVADNGHGVPPEFRKHVFRLFFRVGSELERRRMGTGVGLYIVQTLVHSLKGRVSIHDQDDGTGCVFRVDLPASRPKPRENSDR